MLHPGSQSRDSDFPHGLPPFLPLPFSSICQWNPHSLIGHPPSWQVVVGCRGLVCFPADRVYHHRERPAHH